MAIKSEAQNIHREIIPASKNSKQLDVNRPSLNDLLSRCDPKAPLPIQDTVWEMLSTAGNECL